MIGVVLLARAPVAGRVKSRLAATLGSAAACTLYGAMAAEVWAALRASGAPCYLATEPGAASWLPAADGVVFQPESGGFGERLTAVLAALAAKGLTGALVLGADTPHLDPAAVARGVQLLEDADLVTSPAEDGGVVLMGFRLPPALDLVALPWGTERLDAALLEVAARAGLRVARLLPGSFDLDDATDLRRLLGSPDEVRARCPQTIAAARSALGGLARRGGPAGWDLTKSTLRVLQVNVGDRCNQSCVHCFAASGPSGTRMVSRAVLADFLAVLDRHPSVAVVDITGGSPELAPDMPWFLAELAPRGRHVLFRTNLTALEAPPGSALLPLLVALGAEVVASLPGLTADVVDAQRGAGVFARSLRMLRVLNAQGLAPSLLYNPTGPLLPPPQERLEAEFRATLERDHGIRFDRLYALANVPLGRFRDELRRSGQLAAYESLLRDRHNPAALARVMCRDTLTAGCDGRLYDCEFNRAADLPTRSPAPPTLAALAATGFAPMPVAVGAHCYACTADAGFS